MAIGDFVAPWIKAFNPVQDWEIGQDLAQRKSQQQAQQQEAASRLRQSQYEFGAEQDYKNRDLQMRGQEKKAADLLHQDQLNSLNAWRQTQEGQRDRTTDLQYQKLQDSESAARQKAESASAKLSATGDFIGDVSSANSADDIMAAYAKHPEVDPKVLGQVLTAHQRLENAKRLTAAQQLNAQSKQDSIWAGLVRTFSAQPDTNPGTAVKMATGVMDERKRNTAPATAADKLNAPVAAPVASPNAKPAAQPSAASPYKTPADVKAAVKAGMLSKEQAQDVLTKQFGFTP
jgi:hypothetical protein